MNDEQLDARLRQAPRSARLPEDPWPGIARRMDRKAGWRVRPTMAAAAAVLVFLLGAFSGALLASGGDGESDGPSMAAEAGLSSTMLAATRVQATGSAYVAAVGQLHRLGMGVEADEIVALSQGYEAALAAMETVAETVRHGSFAPPEADELVGQAARTRRSLALTVAQHYPRENEE